MPDEPTGAIAVVIATIAGCLLVSGIALVIGHWIAQ